MAFSYTVKKPKFKAFGPTACNFMNKIFEEKDTPYTLRSGRNQGPLCWGAGGARNALHTEFLPSLLSSEGAFSGISDGLLQENFSGGKAQTAIDSLED